jgi:hypothetical protein
MPCTMLQMVSLMLDNNVDKIRAKANMDLKKKLTSLSVESARVQRIQVKHPSLPLN